MRHKWISSLILAGVTLVFLAAPALAGGWAVVTLDELPTPVAAGQPLSIGFMVRQHGKTPLGGLVPKITATNVVNRASFTTTAQPRGEVGHYVATLTFPSAGTWNWSIDAFGAFPQPMPDLSVSGAALPASHASTNPARAFALVVGLASLAAVAIALLVLGRTRAPWAAALVLVAALASIVGLASAANSAANASGAAPASAQAVRGEALFLAKGCVICHAHAAVSEARREFAGFSIGPNLTNLSATPDFLRKWLKDPSAVKPGAEMPTLGLSDDEINALVAFLTTRQ